MLKRDRDSEDDDSSQKPTNGTVTIKEEVVSPGGAASATIASASNNNMGDRTKDVEELKGMLKTSMDQQGEVEDENAKLKKDAEAHRQELQKMQDKLNLRCTHQLFARAAPPSIQESCCHVYPHPKLLEVVRQGKINPGILDTESRPPMFCGGFELQLVHLSKCSELVDVFKNGLSPGHKLDYKTQCGGSDALFSVSVLTLGRQYGQIVTNENKGDFIILGATTRQFSKPLAELIYDKEWPELTKELWDRDPPHRLVSCDLYIGTTLLSEILQAGISSKPYNAIVKNVHVPTAANPQMATECEVDLDRMVAVDVVTKAERQVSFGLSY